MGAIPEDVAFLLCAAIRHKNRGKWYTFAGLQCWGCLRFSKGDYARMFVSKREDYRGCNLVSKHYDTSQ